MPVDVVVVSYNSRDYIRACVEQLSNLDDVAVVVVDNNSTDGTLESLSGLPVSVVELFENRGFASACNVGWRSGTAPYVLLLNPDAEIDEPSLRRLVQTLEDHPRVGVAAPRIFEPGTVVAFSQGRFPTLSRTFGRALFLHRLFPRAAWFDIYVRDERAYRRAGSPDWVTGACMLLRRVDLERLDGFDEGFFLYCEDMDLCRRLRDLNLVVRYEPESVARHVRGASAPWTTLLPAAAASRIRYARKHDGRLVAALQRIGIGIEALTHVLVARGGLRARVGHARSLSRIVRSVGG